MGPLSGLKVVEMGAIGPVPFCGMMLSDLGADVVRIDRIEPAGLGIQPDTKYQITNRGRRSLAVDLKSPRGIEIVLGLIGRADALIEGFRPGVMERLGIGPEVCAARNGRLVYGRMTGWGQDGPLAQTAGHDINYIGLAGVLHSIGGRGGPPVPPLSLVGDFGGGALYLCVGVLAAIIEARRSGKGQVVDAAMVDGAASLMTPFVGMIAAGIWSEQRGANAADTGSHFYNVYLTADEEYVAIGCVEAKFYAQFLKLIGLAEDAELAAHQMDAARWPDFTERVAKVMRTRTRAEWTALLQNTDVCFAPVLRPSEAPHHPHLKARQTFVDYADVVQPAPAPRFARTPAAIQSPPVDAGANSEEVLAALGLSAAEIAELRRARVIL
ncbi:MAG: CaiB/BaiF CoA transferase family protein [Reyranellaceae bacterium]